MATIVYREDATNLYVDVYDVPAFSEVSANIVSRPSGGNTSTQGVGVSLHNTANADGKLTFALPKSYILPNFPREVTTTVTNPTGTLEQDFTS